MTGQQQQQHEGSSANQQQQHNQQRRHPRQQRNAENVAVIICGFPSQESLDVARACVQRGYRVQPFGLSLEDCKENKINVPEVGEVTLIQFNDNSAKSQLEQAIKQAHNQHLFPVVVDTTNQSDHVRCYNELKVPFVMQTKGESGREAIRDTEAAQQFALITETMNKRLAAFDEMWRDWSRTFPGLLDDHDPFFRATYPSDITRGVLDSFGDLTNRQLHAEMVKPFGQGEEKNLGFTEGQVTREYSFKNGSGSSSFTFRTSMNDKQEYADSMADSVGFLAQQAQKMNRPRVYNILDVARFPRQFLLM